MVHSSLWYCKLIQVAKAKSTVSWFLSLFPFINSPISFDPLRQQFSIEILGLCSFSVFIPAYFSHAMWAPPTQGRRVKRAISQWSKLETLEGSRQAFSIATATSSSSYLRLVTPVIGATLVKNIISWKFLPWNRTYTSQPFAPYVGNGLNIPQQITLFLIQMVFIAFTSS